MGISIKDVDVSVVSPMMQHYIKTKEEYEDCILFYRLGDFYEMFFERAPMCGVPFHAADNYINRLVEKGYKVAICEQMEDPKKAKGIVKREVIRVVTPGTNLYTQALDETKNNYIMSVAYISNRFGIAFADVTTGAFMVTEVEKLRNLLDEIYKFSPAELICNEAFCMSGVDLEELRNRLHLSVSALDNWYFDDDLCQRTLKDHFHVGTLEGLGLKDYDCATIAAGALLTYLLETQKNSLDHMRKITPYITDKYMLIDSSTRRNLELTETMREKEKRGSLLWVLDKTKTAMGARMLRSFIEQPLIEEEAINERLDAVEEINRQEMDREEIREYLGPVYDLERLISRVSYQSANPRDLIAFKTSIGMIPHIRRLLGQFQSEELKKVYEDMDELQDLYQVLDKAIVEDPPLAMKEGGIIKDGYDQQIDDYRQAKTKGKTWLAELEAEEKEKTGIKNLKIKYNKVFGYYLEVTNSFKDMVPDYYTRKQTLTNAERYITPRLKELEDMILGAEDKLYALEYDRFAEIRNMIAGEVERIQKTARAIAKLDAYLSMALVASRNQYVRPKINTRGIIDIKDGRHPVVEKMITNDMFIPNDTYLDNGKNRISVITGPNMAGKSTYMRQTALYQGRGLR